MRFHLAAHRKAAHCPRSWKWYRQDACSWGSINLGRYRIDFGVKR